MIKKNEIKEKLDGFNFLVFILPIKQEEIS